MTQSLLIATFRTSAVVLALSFCPIIAHAEFTGKVVGVIDGDSIRVMHDGKAEQIRLAGIDCPERKQAFGTKAKQATSTLSFGKKVAVRPLTKDRYKRTVATVTLPDGVQLNEELVRQGMCWWYRKYAPHDERLKAIEEAALTQRLGLWKEPNPVPPWEFRKARTASKKRSEQILPSQFAAGIEGNREERNLNDERLPILGNKRSHLYHRADCPNYGEIATKNEVAFANEEAAQSAGYRLAGNCP